MLQELRSKPKGELKAEAHAILSCLRLGMLIPSGQVETRLRKMKGVKEVTVNHVSHTVKIRYDPRIVTIERIRALFKKRTSARQTIDPPQPLKP
ncbi:MAG: heavy-metal-associated domain-containing protein [Candidatus Bathyarchaeia archaeon]